jgi:hypothetical protein
MVSHPWKHQICSSNVKCYGDYTQSSNIRKRIKKSKINFTCTLKMEATGFAETLIIYTRLHRFTSQNILNRIHRCESLNSQVVTSDVEYIVWFAHSKPNQERQSKISLYPEDGNSIDKSVQRRAGRLGFDYRQ